LRRQNTDQRRHRSIKLNSCPIEAAPPSALPTMQLASKTKHSAVRVHDYGKLYATCTDAVSAKQQIPKINQDGNHHSDDIQDRKKTALLLMWQAPETRRE
jgi:hypothetical protein